MRRVSQKSVLADLVQYPHSVAPDIRARHGRPCSDDAVDDVLAALERKGLAKGTYTAFGTSWEPKP